jgi:hypothetical protein
MASVDEWVKWCKSKGLKDSRAYLGGVYEWRRAWRPTRVRVLLVAESHVGEQKEDRRIRVQLPESIRKTLPKRYVRLVYCLGYGESQLCRGVPRKNNGTWQFWDILGAVAAGHVGKEHQQARRRESTDEERLAWKVNVLRTLQRKGIWLVDASIAALYYPGNKPIRVPKELICESFRRFVWPMVERDRPKQVWIIGKRVGRALAGLSLPGLPYKISEDCVISQPQDHDQGRYDRGLRRMILKIRKILH